LALSGLGIHAQALRATRAPSSSTVHAGRIPFEQETKVALERALGQSIALGHHTLSTGHLLLGVMADGDGAAGVGLATAGVRLCSRNTSPALAPR
jgi:Clp amino terminal domain, pathogenicity island component